MFLDLFLWHFRLSGGDRNTFNNDCLNAIFQIQNVWIDGQINLTFICRKEQTSTNLWPHWGKLFLLWLNRYGLKHRQQKICFSYFFVLQITNAGIFLPTFRNQYHQTRSVTLTTLKQQIKFIQSFLNIFLTWLENTLCLFCVQNKKKKKVESFIPYRDSVLTWLLRENLGMHT